jgi:dihydroorotate dehydrogenase
MDIYRTALRPLLFRLDPEWAHHQAMLACRVAAQLPIALSLVEKLYGTPANDRLAATVAGIRFPNPVGLSAGYDKNGTSVAVLSRMGFGYVDVGSVSLEPSSGNAARPRLFRLPADEALVVYYGVPNDGAAVVARRFTDHPSRVPLGVTLVETNTGRPNEAREVITEIAAAAIPFRGLTDMIFISAACPNEESGARPFSDLDNLRRLFEKLAQHSNLPPVFLKIKAPVDQIERIVGIATSFPFIKGFQPSVGPPRPYVGLKTPPEVLAGMPGSATGPHAKPYLLQCLKDWYERLDPARHVLIATGGIRSGADAYDAIRAGASLVGLVTALVFHGPGLARRINSELSALLERDGYANVAGAVGADRVRREHSVV